MTRHSALIATALWLLAAAIRLIFVLDRDNSISIDPSEYLALGQNIRLHGIFSYGAPHQWGDRGVIDATGPFLPTAARAPLYPLMIAALWGGDGPPLLQIRLVQVVLGAFVAVFVYLTALRAFSARTALLAGLAVALGPLNAFLAASIVAETLFSFLLSAALWLWGKQYGVLAGLLIGAATLTRSVILPIIPFIAVLAIVLKYNRAIHARIALAALLVIVPWTARNAVTQHSFIPVSTMGWGANILLGTREVPYGSGNAFLTYTQDKDFMDAIRTTETETQAESLMIRTALERIRQAPLHWLWVRVTQYPRFFVETPSYLFSYVPLPPRILTAVYFLGTFLFITLAGFGMVMALPYWRQAYPLALFAISLAAAFSVGVSEERYSLAILPMMAIFAAFGLSTLTGGSARIGPSGMQPR